MGYTPAILGVLFPSYPLTEVIKFAKTIFEAVDCRLPFLMSSRYQISGGEM